jgi:hypothetical protein
MAERSGSVPVRSPTLSGFPPTYAYGSCVIDAIGSRVRNCPVAGS